MKLATRPTVEDDLAAARRKIEALETVIVRLRQIAEQDRKRAAALEDALHRSWRVFLTK